MYELAGLLRSAIDDEGGQGLVEYSLVIALVGLTCIAALKYFGSANNNNYNTITSAILQAE